MDKNRWLHLLCIAEIGTMMVLLNYSGVLPVIQNEWGLTNTQSGLIYSSYQIGYILLVVILSIMTDYVDIKKIYVFSALWAGLSGIMFALFARGFLSALVFRSLTGFGLAGTYMPGLKMVSARFPETERGRAVGQYVGAFSLGTALSLFVTGLLTSQFHWRTAIFITSLGPIAGALMAQRILENMPPQQDKRAGVSELKTNVLGNRPALLMMVGYMAHMWEMFGMRGWIVAFFAAVFISRNADVAQATSMGAQLSALIILAGGFSTAFAGKLSDRYGRIKTIVFIMLCGAFCSFMFGWLRPLPLAVLILFSLIYGVFVTAESSVLSTAVTEFVPFHCLGGAMALQSFLGWATAAVSPVVFGIILDTNNPPQLVELYGYIPNWGPAFSVLGLGALLGPLVILKFKRHLQVGKGKGESMEC